MIRAAVAEAEVERLKAEVDSLRGVKDELMIALQDILAWADRPRGANVSHIVGSCARAHEVLARATYGYR